MAKRQRVWRWVRTLTRDEKAAIAALCDRFIAEVLKPRFLPEIRPTQFNYTIDLAGKWRGTSYSFIERYRSGYPDNLGEEYTRTFARLDLDDECVEEVRFDVMWLRHTGRYHRLHWSVTLDKALRLIETDELLHPLAL